MRIAAVCVVMGMFGGVAAAQGGGAAQHGAAAPQSALTIYNQDFALVRVPLQLTLQAGNTDVREMGVTAQVESDSVVLRDPTGRQAIHVLEQNYEGSLRSQAQMLAKFEGQTIGFVVPGVNGEQRVVQGKVLRAGTVAGMEYANRYGQNYYAPQPAAEPLIEMEGKLRYGLPGVPLFPASQQGLTLKPTLHWVIASDKATKINAELDYISHGMRWEATYNVIAPAEAAGEQRLALVGWVDVTNETGTDFRDVGVQLMAGDVNKMVANWSINGGIGGGAGRAVMMDGMEQQQISQKSFDEYHLYDLHRRATLLDHQSKQIEFLNAAEIPANKVYVYDGFKVDGSNGIRYLQWNQEDFGGMVSVNKKVWVMQEFKNTEANHLGMPLPKGRMRFYRKDADGSLQFVGENVIDHTPKGEMVRVFLGDAFDLTGERTRSDFTMNSRERAITETYKISLRNAKPGPATVRVVEHLYRRANWKVWRNSDPFEKKDAQTVEFNVEVPGGGEKEVSYTVTYSW